MDLRDYERRLDAAEWDLLSIHGDRTASAADREAAEQRYAEAQAAAAAARRNPTERDRFEEALLAFLTS